MTFEDDWLAIPAHLRPGLARYLVLGVAPGSFLTAVLRNDLAGAVFAASPQSLWAIPDVVRFLCRYVSVSAHGSPDAVADWVAASHREIQFTTPEAERILRAACDLEFIDAS